MKQAKETKKEFAGNASALSTSAPTGLQSDADLHWLADTGATSHMTPHYAWMHNYTPYVVDIHLADNTIVQSSWDWECGSVVLNPVVNGSDLRPVELTRVLPCSPTAQYLLSCLLPHQTQRDHHGSGCQQNSLQTRRNHAVYSYCHPTPHRYCGCFS